jgi:hypothetical protein
MTAGIWTLYPTVIMSDLTSNNPTIGGLFYLEEPTTGTITSKGTTFFRCYTTTDGGVFNLGPSTTL